MRCDLPSYVFASIVSFTAAFGISLRSFVHSELWSSVKDCYDPRQFHLALTHHAAQLPLGLPIASPSYSLPLTCKGVYVSAFFNFVESQKLSLLIHLNMAICCFLVFGKVVIRVFFGSLLPTESQHLYDRMLNFLLFKVVFVAAILDPVWIQILQLSVWIAILGFLRLFSLLSRDRFDHLASMTYIPVADYNKIAILLGGIFMCSMLWFMGSFFLFPMSITFLTLEFLPVALDTAQVMIKYVAQLLEQRFENGFECQRIVNNYAELGTDMLVLGLTLLQYLQLMWIHGISFGFVDIVLFLNVRSVLKSLYRKATIHRDRWRALAFVQNSYIDATSSELSAHNDDCAICREQMKSAKKLMCGHIFHLHCLHAWIHHQNAIPTCPTCRRSMSPSPNPYKHTSG